VEFALLEFDAFEDFPCQGHSREFFLVVVSQREFHGLYSTTSLFFVPLARIQLLSLFSNQNRIIQEEYDERKNLFKGNPGGIGGRSVPSEKIPQQP
jgi:hypothetical protein